MRFLGTDNKFYNYRYARVAVIPVPYERTTSYGKGTIRGPNAILRASGQLENYDIDLDKNIGKKLGIATLPKVDVSGGRERAYKQIKKTARKVLSDGKFPVFLGGEHSITHPIVAAMKQFYKNLCVLHFDAHADLRDSYEEDFYSHACVMRRVFELKVPIVSVGIRSQDEKEHSFAEYQDLPIYYAKDISKNKRWMSNVIKKLRKNVYLSFDVDVFDPSIVPSTGTPEPGGLSWEEIVLFFTRLAKSKSRVVGFDFVELSPKKGEHSPDFLCAKLIYKMIGLFA